MNVRDYLHRIKGYEYAIRDRQEEIKRLRPMLGIKSFDYSSDKVQTSSDGQGFTKIADRIADIEIEVVKLSEERQKIVRMVEAMPKRYHAPVLFDIYALGLSLDDTADDLHLSYGRTSHIHTEALEEFDKRYNISKK